MAQEVQLQYRPALQWGELDPNRRQSTPVGMWAWIWQRISAIAIVFLLGLHITLTYKPLIQFLLLTVVMFHAVLGLRVGQQLEYGKGAHRLAGAAFAHQG